MYYKLESKYFAINHNNRGKYKPKNLISEKIEIEIHDFIVLDNIIMESVLVISHCGAGILLECLRSPRTTCIAVVNETLMNNH